MFPRAWAKPGLLVPKDRASHCRYRSCTKAVPVPEAEQRHPSSTRGGSNRGPGSTLGPADCSSPRVLVTQGWLSQAFCDAGGDTAGLEDSVKVSSKGSLVSRGDYPVPPAGM